MSVHCLLDKLLLVHGSSLGLRIRVGDRVIFHKFSVDIGNYHNPRVSGCMSGMETMVLLNCLVFKTFQCAMLRDVTSYSIIWLHIPFPYCQQFIDYSLITLYAINNDEVFLSGLHFVSFGLNLTVLRVSKKPGHYSMP